MKYEKYIEDGVMYIGVRKNATRLGAAFYLVEREKAAAWVCHARKVLNEMYPILSRGISNA